MAASCMSVLTLSVVATAVLSRCRAVTAAGAVPAAGARCLGFTGFAAAVGERVSVGVMGTVIAETGGAFGIDAALELDSLGRVIVRNSGFTVGHALAAATAAGSLVEIVVVQGVQGGAPSSDVAPVVVTAAAITGTPQQGVALAITGATFSGTPAPTVTRVIRMDGTQVASGTQSTGYTPLAGDVGKIPSVTDTASNGVGSPAASTGAGAAVIAAVDSDALPAVPAGTMLSNFTTAARSLPASMTDNTDGPSPGKTSNVTGYIAPAATIHMRPLDIGASPVDVRNGLISVTFKVRPTGTLARTQANMANCYVNLFANGDPSVAQTNYMRVSFLGGISSGEIANGEWQTLRLPIEIFSPVGTVPDVQAYLQTVRYVGLEFGHNSANSDAYRVSVDFSNSFANPLTKGLVVLGFDDNRRDTFAYAYPKMDALGLVGTLYPGAIKFSLDQNDATFMNTANLLELQAKGWQVAYQAYNTEDPQMTVEEFATNEIAPLKALYPAKGFNGHEDGSYFSNVGFDSPFRPVFAANFRTMRGFKTYTDGTVQQPSSFPRPETLPPSNPLELRAYGVNSSANSFTAGVSLFLARAAARKSVAIVVFHATGAGDVRHAVDGSVLTTFEKTIEYLASPEGRAAHDTVTWDAAVGRWRLAFA